MDNLKTFLGSVMAPHTTPNQSSRPVVDPSKIIAHASTTKPQNGQSSAYMQLQPIGSSSAGLAALGGGGQGRNRTESESSMASDVSSVSSDSSGMPQMKRKDSEPYFWIM